MAERYLDKITRHIQNGEFDLTTLQSGLAQGLDWLLTRNISKAQIGEIKSTQNFHGQDGLHMHSVPLVIEGNKNPTAKVTFLEFPSDTVVRCTVFEDTHQSLSGFASNQENLIAAFDGPTSIRQYPNNGMYGAGKVLEDFKDTNPPGQRRGAMAFFSDGTLSLVDDATKWFYVNNRYQNLEALVGTSTFFDSSDSLSAPNLGVEDERSRVSYIIEFTDKQGLQRFGYMVASNMITRVISKLTIDELMLKDEWKWYRAQELELSNANAVVLGTRKHTPYKLSGQSSGHNRRDHYGVYRKTI